MPKFYGSGTVYIIDQNYFGDEFNPYIVYGKLGIGKSSYAMQVSACAYGTYDNPDWDKMKEYIVFKPEDFVQRCIDMVNEDKREKVLIWDDAGLWLYAMDYNDPFVVAVTKYLNVARTNWASIIFTTPTPTMVIKKLRSLPDCYTVKIIKSSSNRGRKQRLRTAKVYEHEMLPDMVKSRTHRKYEDEDWDCMLPKDVFEWYKPLRKKYTRLAVLEMQKMLMGKLMANQERDVLAKELAEMITL